MVLNNPFSNLAIGRLFETLLPDFVLAFAFFTALCYAVLGQRLGHQRPAIAMSAAIGLALAAGLTWWEYDHGWSVRTLGPVAIGFAVILLAMIMFQGIRHTGGTWSGALIAFGASILVAWILGADWPVPGEIVQTLAIVALIVGIVLFVRRYGLATYIERSKLKGHHVWMFFGDAGVLAAKARRIAQHLLAEIGRPGTEVFPKHDVLSQHAVFGNYIYVALFGLLVPKGRTVFVYPHEPERPYPDQWELLEQVERVPETLLDDIIARHKLEHQSPRSMLPRVVASNSQAHTFGLPPCAQRMLQEGVCRNQRVASFRLAVHLKHVPMPADLAIVTLSAWAKKNHPVDGKRRITDDEIRRQVHAAYARDYRGYGCEDPTVAMFCSPTCPVRLKRHAAMGTPLARQMPGDAPTAREGATDASFRDTDQTRSESQLEDESMSQHSPQRPVKEFRAGPVKIAIWQNDGEQNGQHVVRHSVRIGKRYFDRQQNAWLDSDYFFVNDLPRLRLLVEKAFEFIALKESDPDSAETANGAPAGASIET